MAQRSNEELSALNKQLEAQGQPARVSAGQQQALKVEAPSHLVDGLQEQLDEEKQKGLELEYHSQELQIQVILMC